MTFRSACMTIAAAGLLCACAGGDVIYYSSLKGYTGSDRDYANRGAGIPLVVSGRPSGAATSESAAAAAAAAMSGAPTAGNIRFFPANENADPRSKYFVAVRFGNSGSPAALCEEPKASAGVGSAYGMAFCHDETLLSYLAGDLGGANIGSAGFRQAMSTAASQLMPFENPDLVDCDEGNCN